jgi:T5SS/PEP-CTERM-associated repeat protein/predicted outer membrane repeat protein
MSVQSTTPSAILVIVIVLSMVASHVANATTHDVPAGYPTIQAAISAASMGDEIVVAPGTYPENIDFSGKMITVRSSSGAQSTTIVGQAPNRAVRIANGESRIAKLDGFTITGTGARIAWSGPTITNCVFSDIVASIGTPVDVENASPLFDQCVFSNNSTTGNTGAALGMWGATGHPEVSRCIFSNNSSPTDRTGALGLHGSGVVAIVSHCTFSSNSAATNGGAIVFIGQNASIIRDCVFNNNTARWGGAAYVADNSSPLFERCTFTNNSATDNGGAIWTGGASLSIRHSTFTENTGHYGGAIHAHSSSTMLIERSTFRSNTAYVGGGADLRNAGTAVVRHSTFEQNTASNQGGALCSTGVLALDVQGCLISGNSAAFGAGCSVEGGTFRLTSTTIAGNHASAAAGGLLLGSLYGLGPVDLTVDNCILWDNWNQTTLSQITGVGQFTVTYSDVAGGYAGVGNLNANPEFVDPINTDYRLLPISPCVDAGSNASVPAEQTTDLAGWTRIVDGNGDGAVAVDMGAYEFQNCSAGSEPRIDGQPEEINVSIGQTGTFSVIVASSTLTQYKWKKDGAVLSNTSRISGTDTATLTINSVQQDDQGAYTIEVTNACGSVTSTPAMLSICSLWITQQPLSLIVDIGGSAEFVVAVSEPGSAGYQWRKNGSNINNGGAVTGATSDRLTINPTQLTDAGVYDVIVLGGCAEVTSQAAMLAFSGEFIWSSLAGGAFSEQANWLRYVVPGPNDIAQFDLGSLNPYTVSLTADVTTKGLRIGNDKLTLDLGGYAFSFPNEMVIADASGQLGDLTVINGTLTNRNPTGVTRIATAQGSSARIRVVGTGSNWFNNKWYLADAGSAELRVESGGNVSNDYSYLAGETNSVANAIVSGAGSILWTTQRLEVGGNGNASVVVENGGALTTGYYVFIGPRFGSGSGIVTIDGAGSTAHGNSLDVGSSPPFGQGTLVLRNGAQVTVGNWWMSINETGVVSGSGSIVTQTPCANKGAIEPAGTLTVQGDYEQGAGGVLRIALTGTGAAQVNKLTVSGAATLGGSLELSLLGGYAPALGDEIEIMSVGSLQGQFQTVRGQEGGGGNLLEVLYYPNRVTIKAVQATGVAISPSPLEVYSGFPAQCWATASLSDGHSADVTNSSTWVSDDATVAIVNQGGKAWGQQAGATAIHASIAGHTGTTEVTVRPLPPHLPIVGISKAPGGSPTNNSSSEPSISSDARYIAFCSAATNIVPGHSNGVQHVFSHDSTTGGVALVSASSSDEEGNDASDKPSQSDDGHCVAFSSYASNLVSGDTNNTSDVFVRDLESGTTGRISVDSEGVEADSASYTPDLAALSADGRYVLFYSYASNLVPADTNGKCDVFVHDRHTGGTSRVSVAADGVEGNGNSYAIAIASNARYILFRSFANNLVPGDTNDAGDVFLKDISTGSVERVNLTESGAPFAYGSNGGASISADGRYVVFEGPYVPPAPTQLFVRDRLAGTTSLISLNAAGEPMNQHAFRPHITSDGRFVAFYTLADNMVPGVSSNGLRQVYVRDLQRGVNAVLSRNLSGELGDGESSQGEFPAISADGRYIAYSTFAHNLTPFDMNEVSDIVLADRLLSPASRFDLDMDGDVDTDDLTLFRSCASGPAIVAVSACASRDFDGDSDVDMDDFGTLQRCYSGPDKPVNPACDN